MAAVFPNHVIRSTAAVVDLEKVKVAVCAALQVEKRKGDPKNL